VKIRKLEISGFKSFVDRTVLRFDHDVTAIVGPNGCGKSNVVDAIKWVMGEQSPQRLRGKSMEDVIFSGSETRGPHGFAEVSITFDNTDGLAPPEWAEYPEITVTRRLDRQGNSDYLINRAPVRLLDVTNLFLGTGVGRRAYSTIEQGRIGFIVSSKPEDRRAMIEEAAGITRFKARKRTAERKMEQTRQNLLRVGDIVSELEKSLASLKRQAQKAERYRLYRDEMRDLELWVASHRWLELRAVSQVVDAELEQESGAVDSMRSSLRARETEVEAERLELAEAEATVERAQNRAYELDNRVKQLEGEIRQHLERLEGLRSQERLAERELGEVAGERAALAAERDALARALAEDEAAEQTEAEALGRETTELERRKAAAEEGERAVGIARNREADADIRMTRAEAVLKSIERRGEEGRARVERLRAERSTEERRDAALAERMVELAARLGGLRSGRQQTAERKAELEAELERLRGGIGESDRRVETLRDELAEKRSRLRSLTELHQKFEGVGVGVRALMTRFAGAEGAGARLVGLVADQIECPPALTWALAGALGDRLQYVVVEDLGAAVSAIDFLRGEAGGRATLIPRAPRRVVGERPRLPVGPGVVGFLADLVKAPAEDEGLVRHLLGDTVVVEDIDAAMRLHAEGADCALVTLGGDVLRPDGVLTGGGEDDAGAHMLETKREMRELGVVVARLELEYAAAHEEHLALRRDIGERQAAIDGARVEAHESEIEIVTAERDLRAAEGERKQAAERAAALELELAELSAELERAAEEAADARSDIESARSAREGATEELRAAEAVLEERRRAVEEQTALVTEVRVRVARARERAEGDRATIERLSRSIEELDGREERLRGDVLRGAEQQGRILGEVVLFHETLSGLVREAMDAHETVGAARGRYEELRLEVSRAELALKELRGQIEERSTRVNELTLRARELAMETAHLLQSVQERQRLDVRRVLTDYHSREVPDETVRDRIDELGRLIQRMGEINLLAIEEYDEKSKRHDYLKGQKEDLEQALEQLDRAIRQMNRESRKMFREAFDAVNERFKRIFPMLFRGGRAELRLTNPEDLLESGVDILAQPPGKRLGSLELMSGGEKAFTAVALIFSLFQYRPSPFCLLDEVDAPLDEANIGRFAEAIRQMTDRSQFIIITHSKRTMEFADVLYGVTMEQPGVSNLVAVELRGERRPVPVEPEDRAAVA
jgi:chromosome segregation protein